MSSPRQLTELVDIVTSENAATNEAPPAVASENPLIELLIHEVQSGVPSEIRRRLSSVGDSTGILDWIGIATVLKPLPSSDQQRVLAELGNDPKRLPQALVIAWPYEPIMPSEKQCKLDFAGLALQLGFAALLLAIRSVIILRFAQVTIRNARWELLAGVVYLPLLANPNHLASRVSWGLLTALLMLLFDFTISPKIMERLRQWPAVVSEQKAVWQQRADSLQSAWQAQAVFFGLVCFGKLATTWVIQLGLRF